MFVFKGGKINSQFQVLKDSMDSAGAKARLNAWDSYYVNHDKQVNDHAFNSSVNNLSFKSNYINSKSYLNSNKTFDISPHLNDLIKFIHGLGLEYIVAPYTSWSELNYLYANGYVDAIYGPTECLLTNNIDKFILGMEFQTKEFRFVDRKSLLHGFRINLKQFKEISVTVGFDIQPYSLANAFSSFITPDLVDFKWLHDFVQNGTSVYGVLLNNAKKSGTNSQQQTNLDHFKNGMSALDFLPVLKTSGRVELLSEPDGGFPPLDEILLSLSSGSGSAGQQSQTSQQQPQTLATQDSESQRKEFKQDVPRDIHEFVGQRLPHEYYFYQSIGLVEPKLLETVVFDNYLELPPLDGGNSDQYKALVNSQTNFDLKNKTLNLFTSSMPRYFQVKRIYYVKWFDNRNPRNFDFRTTKPLFLKLAHYLVKQQQQQVQQKTENNGQFNIKQLFAAFDKPAEFLANVVHDVAFSEKQDDLLQTSHDVLATALVRALYLYDFISLTDNKLTGWGQVLNKLANIGETQAQIEKLFLLLIFFKNHASTKLRNSEKLLLNQSFKPTVHGEPKVYDNSGKNDKEELNKIKQYVLVITRLSLLHDASSKSNTCHNSSSNSKTVINLNTLNKLSLNLLSFRSILQFVKTQFNELNQSLLVSLLCGGQFDRKKSFVTDDDSEVASKEGASSSGQENNISATTAAKETSHSGKNKNWKNFVNEVPLKKNLPNTITAIITEVYFEYLNKILLSSSSSEVAANGKSINSEAQESSSSNNNNNNKKAISEARDFITNTYGLNIPDVLNILDENFKFINMAFSLVEEIYKINDDAQGGKKLIDDEYFEVLQGTKKYFNERI